MKDNTLFKILDLIEEINKVNKMIDLHNNSSSDFMLNQYINKKLKLSRYLFKELLSDNENRPDESMYIIKLFIEKFYDNKNSESRFSQNDSLKRIENVFIENYS